ncbi:hypothetical protein QE152_g36795 [Popillia japonica]|uniref:Uncharacterized protein n=1 Tax=Popillia japonica TaxID=7064 RepID=A0AAW1ICF2_POPJA
MFPQTFRLMDCWETISSDHEKQKLTILILPFLLNPYHGLLGDDFLRSRETKIDYSNSTISIKSIPFSIPLCHNTPQSSISTITINERTETIVPIKVVNPNNLSEGIISSQKINQNQALHIPSAIVNIKNKNQSFITMINTSMEKQVIPIPELTIEPIPNVVNIYRLAENQPNNSLPNRLESLSKNLRLNHLNEEEKSSISKLCKEFNDIFHLSSDLLTKTTNITHNIPTIDE